MKWPKPPPQQPTAATIWRRRRLLSWWWREVDSSYFSWFCFSCNHISIVCVSKWFRITSLPSILWGGLLRTWKWEEVRGVRGGNWNKRNQIDSIISLIVDDCTIFSRFGFRWLCHAVQSRVLAYKRNCGGADWCCCFGGRDGIGLPWIWYRLRWRNGRLSMSGGSKWTVLFEEMKSGLAITLKTSKFIKIRLNCMLTTLITKTVKLIKTSKVVTNFPLSDLPVRLRHYRHHYRETSPIIATSYHPKLDTFYEISNRW